MKTKILINFQICISVPLTQYPWSQFNSLFFSKSLVYDHLKRNTKAEKNSKQVYEIGNQMSVNTNFTGLLFVKLTT